MSIEAGCTPAPSAEDLASALAEVFGRERGYLFGLCYRMTGSAADAEDLVQSAFERALAHPPRDLGRPWRPWLTRVVLHLARDQLRRRRRRSYVGPWLPEPLDLDSLAPGALDPTHEATHDPGVTPARYDLLESLSYAFLAAIERLSPTQRATLLLCDVFEYSGPEASAVLGLQPANVRQHLRRARAAMASYDAQRAPLRSLRPKVLATLQGLMRGMERGDIEAIESLLAREVVLISDGGGEYAAARVPVIGAGKVRRFLVNVAELSGPSEVEIRPLNGLPALVGRRLAPRPGFPPRFVMLLDLGADGLVQNIFSVVASAKLRGSMPVALAPEPVAAR